MSQTQAIAAEAAAVKMPWIKGRLRERLRRARRWPGMWMEAVRPVKAGRSLAYHTGLYALIKKDLRGVHLGSGGLRIAGFVNCDADAFLPADLIANSRRLKFAANSVGTIYASHLFEHIGRNAAPTVLANWFRVLRPGGELILCVPDVEALANMLVEHLPAYSEEPARRRVDLVMGVLYGGQTDKFDFHFAGYTFATLSRLLESAGFQNVQRVERASLAFAPFKDGGYAEIEGTLISLNVRAVKPAQRT